MATTVQVGLALSGGGFRATLFHLGVVRALRDLGLLSDVRNICSVSGGSVLAAHLVLNWSRYTGSIDEFESATAEIIEFVQKDVRGRILRRLPQLLFTKQLLRVLRPLVRIFGTKALNTSFDELYARQSVTGSLEQYYKQLYKDAYLTDLNPTKSPDIPKLYILATNLNMADLCWFSDEGFTWDTTNTAKGGDITIPVAKAVAASSAFPGFFPPAVITREMLGLSHQELSDSVLYITDAGVYDNLGISHFIRLLAKADTALDHVIVSDATGAIDWTNDRRVSRLQGTAWRTIEIIMQRARQLQEEAANPVTFSFVRISDHLVNSALMPQAIHRSLQAQLRFVRTDLDYFSLFEVHCLVQHGYSVARQVILNNPAFSQSDPVNNAEICNPDWPGKGFGCSKPTNRQVLRLQSARERKVRLWSRKDPVSWIHAGLLALAIALVSSQVPLFVKYLRSGMVDTSTVNLAIVPPPPAEKVRSVSFLNTPKYDEFDILEDRRVVDMRGWQYVSSDKIYTNPISPANWRKILKLRKKVQVREVRLEMRTTGYDINIRSSSQSPDGKPLNYFFERTEAPDSVTKQMVKIWNIVFDVSDIEVGKEFVLDVEATYWNGFQESLNGNEDWIGVGNYGPTKLLILTLIFPDSKPFKSYRLVSYPYGEREQLPFSGNSTVLFDGAHKSLYWEIPEPLVQHVYRVYWTW